MNGIKRTFSFIIIAHGFLLLIGCAQTKDTSVGSESDVVQPVQSDTSSIAINDRFDIQSYYVSFVQDTSLVQQIDYDCAVFIYPDEAQERKMKSEYGEEDFLIVADDNNWYADNAGKILDSIGIVKAVVTKPFVAFHGESGAWTMNLRKKGALEWNLVFFNRQKEPRIISTVDLTRKEVYEYFNQRE